MLTRLLLGCLLITVSCFGALLKGQDTSFVLRTEYVVRNLPFGLIQRLEVPRPKLGIALSGGGAKGLAQIGILRALIEKNVPIDMIVGTSIGSIIGGLYSIGYSIDDIDSIASSTGWSDLIAGVAKSNRRELFIDQKLSEDKAVLTLRLRGLNPILPSSINDGQRLTNYLNLLSFQAPIRLINNFDNFEIPFRAVATNLVTGEPYILKSGSLTQAMRASSSVSFLLSPVRYDTTLLVDGGLVANIPVEITRNEGADFVVAFNATGELHTPDKFDLPWIVADQVISIPLKILNSQQLQKADFVITPSISTNTLADFSNIDSAIQIGYKEALPIADSLEKVYQEIYYNKLKQDEKYLKRITIDESSGIGREILLSYIGKDSISTAKILYDLYRMNKNGEYLNVAANITISDGDTYIRFSGERAPVIKSVAFDGITLIDTAAVGHKMKRLLNKPFEGKRVLSAVKEILQVYRTGGYSLAEIDSLFFEKDTGRLNIFVKEGVIEDIVLTGNTSTISTIITREFPLKAGDIFRYDSFQQGLINLRSTNLFENIIVSVDHSGGGNKLVLEVFEKETNLMRVGFKMDNENNPQISVDIRNNNVFGTGSELGLLLYLSPRGTDIQLEHRANRVFDTYITYKINAYYTFDDINSFTESIIKADEFRRLISGEYRQSFTGISLSLGTQVRRFGNVIFSGKYEEIKTQNLRVNSVNEFTDNVASVKVSSTIDTQDKYPYPDKGLRFHAFYETALKAFGSSISYSNLGLEYKGYIPVADGHVLGTGARLGFADATLPLPYQYSMGGQNSFFGMREDEFRGRQIFLTSVEYRFKFPFDIYFETYMLFRYDLGSIWEVKDQIRFNDLRHGLGTTLSFKTPIGPADFSVGRSFRFTKNISDTPVRYGPVYLYFSIGYYY